MSVGHPFELQSEHTMLAIESSCDDTSFAVLRAGRPLALTVSSQVELHRPFGGVVPELASRHHLEAAFPLLEETLQRADIGLEDLDAIAVTRGPGLAGSLLVGVALAKMLSALLRLPLFGVNHMEGHLYSARLDGEVPCPFVCLICSGGHTQLLHVPKEGQHILLGETRDDAAGEAFDKVAKLLGLPYPGGPVIDRLAREGSPKAFSFPRPMLDRGYEFSFSGLKTAVRRTFLELQSRDEVEARLPDLAASFQAAVVEVLIAKLFRAAKAERAERVAVVGGVACNSELRTRLRERAERAGLSAHTPSPIHCTDNAAMIGRAAWDLRHLLPAEFDSELEIDLQAAFLQLP